MAFGEPLYTRRKADKLRLAGWINAPVTAVLTYFCPATVPAIIAACAWVVVVFAVTQGLAWRLDKQANRIGQR